MKSDKYHGWNRYRAPRIGNATIRPIMAFPIIRVLRFLVSYLCPCFANTNARPAWAATLLRARCVHDPAIVAWKLLRLHIIPTRKERS
jgi:hypothetical protein